MPCNVCVARILLYRKSILGEWRRKWNKEKIRTDSRSHEHRVIFPLPWGSCPVRFSDRPGRRSFRAESINLVKLGPRRPVFLASLHRLCAAAKTSFVVREIYAGIYGTLSSSVRVSAPQLLLRSRRSLMPNEICACRGVPRACVSGKPACVDPLPRCLHGLLRCKRCFLWTSIRRRICCVGVFSCLFIRYCLSRGQRRTGIARECG